MGKHRITASSSTRSRSNKRRSRRRRGGRMAARGGIRQSPGADGGSLRLCCGSGRSHRRPPDLGHGDALRRGGGAIVLDPHHGALEPQARCGLGWSPARSSDSRSARRAPAGRSSRWRDQSRSRGKPSPRGWGLRTMRCSAAASFPCARVERSRLPFWRRRGRDEFGSSNRDCGFWVLSRRARCHAGANHRRFRTRVLSIRQTGGSPAGISDRRRPYPA